MKLKSGLAKGTKVSPYPICGVGGSHNTGFHILDVLQDALLVYGVGKSRIAFGGAQW